MFMLKPITAALVQTTGFRMEKVVTMSLKAGNFGTLVEVVGRKDLIFCKIESKEEMVNFSL